jgi:hypothetical protein
MQYIIKVTWSLSWVTVITPIQNAFFVSVCIISVLLSVIKSLLSALLCTFSQSYAKGISSLINTQVLWYFLVKMRLVYVFLKFLSPTGLLSSLQTTCEWIWRTDRMILTEENRRTQRKTCRSVTSLTSDSIWTALGVVPGLRSEKAWSDCAIIGSVLR